MSFGVATGVDGNITFVTGHNAKFDRWEAVYGQRMINISGFDSGGDEEAEGNMRYGRGAATGTMRYGTNPNTANTATAIGSATLVRTGQTITLVPGVGCTISHLAIVSEVMPSVDVNGEARVTFNYTKTGPSTETWST